MNSTAGPERVGEDDAGQPPVYWLAVALMAAEDARQHAREVRRAAWARDAGAAREAVQAAEDAAAEAATGAAQAARYAPRDVEDARAYAADAAAAAHRAREHAGPLV